MKIVGYRILDEKVIGHGGFLLMKRVRVQLEREDGSLSAEGLYDFIERPMGLDAVVLVLWHRQRDGSVEVLLRHGHRLPLDLGRPSSTRAPTPFTEVVAGIVERGEESEASLRKRAAAEALEEAGITVEPSAIHFLGELYPTPGMCPELFWLCDCEIDDAQRRQAKRPPGDGSPFEEGARLEWVGIDEALSRCRAGQIRDMKTELILRRLKELL
jgi:ADP-ribose pyrophosphatase